MARHPSQSEVAAVEREAQQLIDSGRGSTALRLALEQLGADRANGETLDTALQRVREILDGGHRRGPR